jgi:hypothetical protein
MKITMYTSLLSSIIIQIITGLIEFGSLFLKVPLQYTFLKQMMMLELFVQFIEGSFYIYWFYHFNTIANITPNRYLDWVITTPTMLINLIFYLIFLKYKDTETLDFFTLFQSEFSTISIVLLLNWMMLLFGYLGETSVIPVSYVSLGFIPFFIYYYIIYEKYALTNDGLIMFFYFLFFWSLYGLVAVLPYKLKNMCYNILDLFAKNFFGLLLTYSLFTNSIQ